LPVPSAPRRPDVDYGWKPLAALGLVPVRHVHATCAGYVAVSCGPVFRWAGASLSVDGCREWVAWANLPMWSGLKQTIVCPSWGRFRA